MSARSKVLEVVPLEPPAELGGLHGLHQDERVEDDEGAVGKQLDEQELAPENVVRLKKKRQRCEKNAVTLVAVGLLLLSVM